MPSAEALPSGVPPQASGGAVGPCEPVDALATPAFDLDPPVRHTVHTVGPVRREDSHRLTRLDLPLRKRGADRLLHDGCGREHGRGTQLRTRQDPQAAPGIAAIPHDCATASPLREKRCQISNGREISPAVLNV